jgi:hypothetical protein
MEHRSPLDREVVAMARLLELNERCCFFSRSASSFGDFFMSFRWTTLGLGLVALAPFAWSQQPQLHREIPEDAFGTRQLIVWSGVQNPPSTPQPLPSPDTQTPPPDQRSNPHTQPTLVQSLSGWIVRDGDRYGLKTAGNMTYEFDQPEGVQQYENKNVQVVGKLDAASNTIHIVKIELMP